MRASLEIRLHSLLPVFQSEAVGFLQIAAGHRVQIAALAGGPDHVGVTVCDSFFERGAVVIETPTTAARVFADRVRRRHISAPLLAVMNVPRLIGMPRGIPLRIADLDPAHTNGLASGGFYRCLGSLQFGLGFRLLPVRP